MLLLMTFCLNKHTYSEWLYSGYHSHGFKNENRCFIRIFFYRACFAKCAFCTFIALKASLSVLRWSTSCYSQMSFSSKFIQMENSAFSCLSPSILKVIKRLLKTNGQHITGILREVCGGDSWIYPMVCPDYNLVQPCASISLFVEYRAGKYYLHLNPCLPFPWHKHII